MPPAAMSDPTLSPALEAAALRALRQSWAQLNDTLFDGTMRPPQIEATDATAEWGRWVRGVRVLGLSRRSLTQLDWGALIELLKHEMAHQYVDEVLGVRDETAHGPAFRQVCARRGIDARALGVPVDVGAAGEGGEGAILARIAKLLRLAESPNEHEAQAAMRQAQRLMLKHNLDAAEARAARGYVFKHVGVASGRVDEASRWVATILGEFFFVECIWVPVWRVLEGRAGSVLEVCGTVENLSMAEYVHSFLHHTADGLWTTHKRRAGIDGDRDRRAYRAGVMAGFWERLRADRKEDTERGLVWVGDPALRGYFRGRHPRVRSVSHGGSGSAGARDAGRAEGRKLVLHKGMERAAPSGGGAVRQLGSGRTK
jgi:hypothetical protein